MTRAWLASRPANDVHALRAGFILRMWTGILHGEDEMIAEAAILRRFDV